MASFISHYDLHSHSSASDGWLSPAELVERAVGRRLSHLALTDHDTVRGVDEAVSAAGDRLRLIPGVELSATWREKTQIHVVGLFIDTLSPELTAFLERQGQLRASRAAEIGGRLERIGFKDAYRRVLELVPAGSSVTRGTYARLIVRDGKAAGTDEAFNTYLKRGRPAYVATRWPDFTLAVGAIHAAGGVAVLAHPRRYLITNAALRALLADFKEAGGEAIEVASSQQSPNERDFLSKLALSCGFLGSMGSDFHQALRYRDLGLNLRLPAGLTPVWRCSQAAPYAFS